MKFRFPLNNQHVIGFKGEIPYLGIDTDEIVSFHLTAQNELQLWFRGIPSSVTITEDLLGQAYFKDLLTLVCSDFQHIDNAKPRISLLADLRKPLNIDQ
ncbi:hypothetical protein [Microcoleus sp. B3-D7]|uniref:hypothetical protein n=1 Tax=Microcoleus sp. B3-D7 TaxID=2818659 RepID=UPI002FD51986